MDCKLPDAACKKHGTPSQIRKASRSDSAPPHVCRSASFGNFTPVLLLIPDSGYRRLQQAFEFASISDRMSLIVIVEVHVTSWPSS
jgi:hypothetical protein